MNEEFLTQLGLDGETAGKILAEHNRELEGERLSAELTRAINAAGAKDEAAVRALLADEQLEPESISEKIGALKKEHPALFEKENTPRIVSAAADTGTEREGFEKMGYMQRLKLFCENPELYKKLV